MSRSLRPQNIRKIKIGWGGGIRLVTKTKNSFGTTTLLPWSQGKGAGECHWHYRPNPSLPQRI